MKKISVLCGILLLMGVAAVRADDGEGGRGKIVTMSNSTNVTAPATGNNLLVYNTKTGALLQSVASSPAQKGGVSGNGGGVAADGDLVAIVNFTSQSVSIFKRNNLGAYAFSQLISIAGLGSGGGPVSVAFGEDHLYILSQIDATGSKVASYPVHDSLVATTSDSSVTLNGADKSPAQVGVIEGDHLVVTEKANGTPAATTTVGAIETVNLDDGRLVSPTTVLTNPALHKDPFGIATSDDNAYVAFVQSNQISLVRAGGTNGNGKVLNTVPTTATPQKGPNWLTLDDDFLFSSDSVALNIFRYGVFGQQIIANGVAATFTQAAGPPTKIVTTPSDITSREDSLAVIVQTVTTTTTTTTTAYSIRIYSVDEDGNLTFKVAASADGNKINGLAFVGGGDD